MDNPNTNPALEFTTIEARLDEALKELKKLSKKAERRGTPPITWAVGPSRMEVFTLSGGRKSLVAVRDLTLNEMEAPRVGDFQFIARLELRPEGVIIDSVPGEELPARFRHSTGECEHCRRIRDRRHLFVVRDPEGVLVQVGRSCLRDYMGTDTPASVVARFQWFKDLRDWGDNWGAGSVGPDSADELLAVTACAIRLWGWVPMSAPGTAGAPTAIAIGVWWGVAPGNSEGKAKQDQLRRSICDSDWATAQEVRDWVMSAASGDSDYIHNLRVVLGSGLVESRRRPLACSAVAAWQRHKGDLAERQRRADEARSSCHLGQVGERLKSLRVRCESARGVDSQRGTSVMYKLVDDSGNHLCWFCSGSANMDVGRTYLIDATVKEHSEFRGVLETQITRATIRSEVQG